MNLFFIFTVFVFPICGGAKIFRNEVSRATFETYTLKNVCDSMGYKNLLMIDIVNSTTIDCMTHKVRAKEFCQKKIKENKLFVRGFVDKKKEEVVCQKGHNVLLSLSCDDKHFFYCSASSKKGCMALKQHFAINHEFIHSSLLKEKEINILNCYYSAKQNENE